MAQPRSAAATKRSRGAENRSDREALEDAMKSAVHCAQRVMALLENNELKGDDEEQSLDSFGHHSEGDGLPKKVHSRAPASPREL